MFFILNVFQVLAIRFRCQGDGYCDISPRLEAGGFLSSLRGFPASRRLAWLGFHRPRSYGLSTGSNRESHGQNVLCSIDVAVMMNATFRASPRSDIKREGVENMSTIKAALGGGG